MEIFDGITLVTIAQIIQQTQRLSEEKIIKVQGWVKSLRQSKFIILNDGSCSENLQIVCPSDWAEELAKINLGSSLVVSGRLFLTPERKQIFELQAQEVKLINCTTDDYPLQKKKMLLENIRNYPHLKAKTSYFLAMFRLRSDVSQAIHSFFHQSGFYYLPTPIITSNDAEGAGASFTVTTQQGQEYQRDFFQKHAMLTVSGQLQLESLVQGLGKVYTFSPCFRAENSHTTRHLAEFWMIEPEIAFAGLEEIIYLSEKMIKNIVQHVLTHNLSELRYFEQYQSIQLISKLKNIVNDDFPKITYTEAIKILKKSPMNFIHKDIYWGMDLKAEHEKYLCQHFNYQPLFVLDYPRQLKAFYMKNNADGKTVACLDLLFPIGEVIGGSAREDNYQILLNKAQEVGLNINNLNWYFNLRKFGHAPSAGFGLGLERLLMFLSGAENVQDVIPFPRYSKHLEF